MGQLDRAARPGDRLTIDLPQDRVGETRSRAFPRQFDQLHALVNAGMRGYPIEIPQLINSHPQGHPNFGVEPRRRPPGIMLDQKIELGLEPQRPQHDFRG